MATETFVREKNYGDNWEWVRKQIKLKVIFIIFCKIIKLDGRFLFALIKYIINI